MRRSRFSGSGGGQGGWEERGGLQTRATSGAGPAPAGKTVDERRKEIAASESAAAPQREKLLQMLVATGQAKNREGADRLAKSMGK